MPVARTAAARAGRGAARAAPPGAAAARQGGPHRLAPRGLLCRRSGERAEWVGRAPENAGTSVVAHAPVVVVTRLSLWSECGHDQTLLAMVIFKVVCVAGFGVMEMVIVVWW